MFYLFVVLILIILLAIGDNKHTFLIGFLFLLILSALRAKTVGTDTEMYVNIFLGREAYFRDIEPGYALMMQIIKLISGDQQFFLFVTTLIIFVPIYFFIKNNSPKKLFSLLLFVLAFNYYFSLSGLRQSIATSFILLALDNLTIKNIKYFIFWILVATTFHTSAIMVLPIALIFYTVEVNTKLAFALLAISFVVGWGDLFHVRDAVSNLKSVGGGLVDVSKYNTYADYSFGNSVNNVNAKIFSMVPNTLICLTLLYFSKKTINFYTSFFWLGTILINLFVDIPIAFRVAYYLTFMQITLIPTIFERYNRPRLMYILYTIAFLGFFTFQTFKIAAYKLKNPGRNDVVPYKTFNE